MKKMLFFPEKKSKLFNLYEARCKTKFLIRRTKRGVTTCILLPTIFNTHTNTIRRNKLSYALPLVCN